MINLNNFTHTEFDKLKQSQINSHPGGIAELAKLKKVLKGIPPSSLAELNKLKGAPTATFTYASAVMSTLTPEQFLVHETAPMALTLYAVNVIKGAWPEAEPIICKRGDASFMYASLVKKRFKAGEKMIMNHHTWRSTYETKFNFKFPVAVVKVPEFLKHG